MAKRIKWQTAGGGELYTKRAAADEEARLKKKGFTVRRTRKKNESARFGEALYLIEYH